MSVAVVEAHGDVDDSPACTCCMTPASRWESETYNPKGDI